MIHEGAEMPTRDRLEKWLPANISKLNKAKCEVLQLGEGNPQLQQGVGEREQLCREVLWVIGG